MGNEKIKDAIKWLREEYPSGVELVYIDYNNSFNDDAGGLAGLLKNGYMEDDHWLFDASWYTIDEVIGQYTTEHTDDDFLDNETTEAMRDWLQENDTSTPIRDLLKNTSYKLCFIETDTDFIHWQDGGGEKNIKSILKKYAKNKEQEDEIRSVLSESFYSTNISFYFYLNMLDLFNVLHGKNSNEKYVIIDGAYFSTITRGNGSNWLGDKNIFKLAIPREDFLKNFYLDDEDGTGYSWRNIAGQTGYEEAGVYNNKTQKRGAIRLYPQTSEGQKQERMFAENWKNNKTCIFGDMNMSRHKNVEYINEFPCGSKCKDCGTFWID